MNMDYPLAISRSYGKSPLFIGKSKLLSSKNGPLSTARLNNQGELIGEDTYYLESQVMQIRGHWVKVMFFGLFLVLVKITMEIRQLVINRTINGVTEGNN